MSSDHESEWYDRLKARIEEYNQRDRQAIARASEERDKWLRAEKKGDELPSPDA